MAWFFHRRQEHSSEDMLSWQTATIPLQPPDADCHTARQTLQTFIDDPSENQDVPQQVWTSFIHARQCASPDCRKLARRAYEV